MQGPDDGVLRLGSAGLVPISSITPNFRISVVVLAGNDTRVQQSKNAEISESYGLIAPGKALRYFGEFTGSVDLPVAILVER